MCDTGSYKLFAGGNAGSCSYVLVQLIYNFLR